MNIRKILQSTSFALLCIASGLSHANLVTNGDFETGTLSGWSLSNVNCCTGINGSAGNYVFTNGNINSTNATLAQSISTVAGTSYTLTFDLLASGDVSSYFAVNVGGSNLFGFTNPNTGNVWTTFSASFVGTGSDTISFVGYDNPSWWYLDNVTVSAASNTVPEPTSLLLLGLGLAGLGASRLRKTAK